MEPKDKIDQNPSDDLCQQLLRIALTAQEEMEESERRFAADQINKMPDPLHFAIVKWKRGEGD